MPRIPKENTSKGGKQELIKTRYVMKVLQSVERETIDTKHPDYGRDQKIGLYDIVSPASMRKVEEWSNHSPGKVHQRECRLRILSPMSVCLPEPPDLK